MYVAQPGGSDRRRAICCAAGLLLLALPVATYSQVTFTEVMFDPIGPESTDEFIEFLNLSSTDTVDLTGWWVSDGRAVDSLADAGSGLRFAPGQFAVILDPSYFGGSSSYDGLIPEAALVLTLDNATFGSGGLSNRVARTLVLGDASGDTVSVYTYSPGNSPGHSDEKVDPQGPNSPENWSDSRIVDGTPGAANSVTPPLLDLALGPAPLAWRPERPRWGQPIDLLTEVVNVGLRTVSAYRLEIYDDVDGDSLAPENERILLAEGGPLDPGESTLLELRWQGASAGYHALLVRLVLEGDLRPENNTVWAELIVGFPSQALVINELMYRPRTGDPEWVELFNPGRAEVSLRGWKLRDAKVDRTILLADNEVVVGPGGYRVVAAAVPLGAGFVDLSDSVLVPAGRFPTLNNDADEVVLSDPLGYSIDSVAYRSDWGSAAGVSLEKVWFERSGNDAANWALSVDSLGATPGRINSTSPRGFDVGVFAEEIVLFPEKPRAEDAVLLTVPVRNVGRQPANEVEVVVYEDRDGDGSVSPAEEIGRRTVSQPVESEAFVNVEFDLGIVSSGWHLLQIEARVAGDQRPENDRAEVLLAVGYPEKAVVVNEILFEPQSARSEWVELYNRSDGVVDLRAWTVADSTGRTRLPDRSIPMQPGAFVVLAADSSVLDNYGVVNADVLILKNYPTLNNDVDRVDVGDMHGRRIDGVRYRGSWGGGPGVSLERLHPDLASTDSTTWFPSVDPLGATPGRANSVFTQVQPTTTALEIAPNPFSPDGDGVDDFAVVSFRLPQPAATVNVKIFDMRGRLVRQLLNNAPTAAERHLIWDGLNERGERLEVGIYIVYLEAIRPEVGFLRRAKRTVVLARRR